MESPLGRATVHWDLEPMAIPLTRLRGQSRFGAAKARPTDTLSPIGGEGRGEGARFMESPLTLSRTHWDHEPGRRNRLH